MLNQSRDRNTVCLCSLNTPFALCGDCAAWDCTVITWERDLLGNKRTQLEVRGNLICSIRWITWGLFNLCFISPVWFPFGQICLFVCAGVAKRWKWLLIYDSLTIHYVFLGPKLTSPWPSISQPPMVSQLMHTHTHTGEHTPTHTHTYSNMEKYGDGEF